MHSSHRWAWSAVVGVSLLVSGLALAKGAPRAVVVPRDQVKWSEAGIPGVSTAAVEGDMAKGPSHFYLRYAAGFVAPPHHHTPDHYVTVVSGNLVLITNGKEHPLGPGSYFALTGKAVHSARVGAGEDCVMFVDARGPWDVVLEKNLQAQAKP
jgi:quercetin dioxygenase-like cupin family protein